MSIFLRIKASEIIMNSSCISTIPPKSELEITEIAVLEMNRFIFYWKCNQLLNCVETLL